jgi:hypothetical protein
MKNKPALEINRRANFRASSEKFNFTKHLVGFWRDLEDSLGNPSVLSTTLGALRIVIGAVLSVVAVVVAVIITIVKLIVSLVDAIISIFVSIRKWGVPSFSKHRRDQADVHSERDTRAWTHRGQDRVANRRTPSASC